MNLNLVFAKFAGMAGLLFGLAAAQAAVDSPIVISFSQGVLLDSQKRADPRQFLSASLEGSGFRNETVVAYEDNGQFTYLSGEAFKGEAAPEGSTRLLRRMLVVKPSTFVIDDQIKLDRSDAAAQWQLGVPAVPVVNGNKASVSEANGRWDITVLSPAGISLEAPAAPRDGGGQHVRAVARGNGNLKRFVHVLEFRRGNDSRAAARLEFASDQEELTLGLDDRTVRVRLPRAENESAGSIEVVPSSGGNRLERRLLPSGVLPYGSEGRRLLERWDNAYRSGGSAPWDTGRPSSEVKKLVEARTVQAGRAIELGCGTGTSAIYLASRGFDVTGVDIAPSGLRLAERKAAEAGARVRWTLADILAMPRIGQFDFVFDRGCYHGVRAQNAAVYVETLKQLTHPGSRVLILAGNANEAKPHYGPPRVTEQELRTDFGPWFEFESLQEIRFDTADSQGRGALAWSILLRRKP